MAKVDADSTFYMNPAAYTNVKPEKQESKKTKGIGSKSFSNLFDDLKGKTADEIGPLYNLPPTEESVNYLIDEVRSSGDVLKDRPFPEEIMKYKQAVRNFINFVVQNNYSVERETSSLPKKHLPSFTGRRNTPEADEPKKYVKIQIIDEKLDKLAANLLTSQKNKLELVSSLEEIRGLLIDLLE